jgi:hypothetical protein
MGRNITGTTQQALAEFARNHGALQILVLVRGNNRRDR